MSSKVLWLTPLTRSNDTEEVIRTFEKIWDKIRGPIKEGIKDLPNYKQVMDLLDQQMKVEVMVSMGGHETPYALCLTVNRDLAQNWNEYGDMSQGIALGFSDELFLDIVNDMPHPSSEFVRAIGWNQVYYDKDNLAQGFVPLFIELLRDNPNALGWLNIRTTLKHYSGFIKNATFQDEKEVRIVYYPNEDHIGLEAVGVSGLIQEPFPHCTLSWIKSTGVCALKEIIIGTNCEYTIDDVKELLRKNNIDADISVIRSEYPYRKSANR